MIDRNAAVLAAGLEFEPGFRVRRPAKRDVAVVDQRLCLLPDHLANPFTDIADIDTGANLQQPDRQPAALARRHMLCNDH